MDSLETHCFIVTDTDADRRLDLFLAEQLPDIRRNQLQRLITDGNARIDGAVVTKNATRVRIGSEVELDIPIPDASPIAAEDIPIDILYEDDDLAVLNKPAGLAVHPTPFLQHGTLVNGLLFHLKSLSGIGGVLRPGIVHRLDKGTSGIMVVAKNDHAHAALSAQFSGRVVRKEYLALVTGCLEPASGRVEGAIGRHPVNRKIMAIVSHGRQALTEYRAEERFNQHTLVRVFPHTGRTHQIRVHMKSIGHVVVGDTAYGYRARAQEDKSLVALLRDYPGFCLHAAVLEFTHPRSGEPMRFEKQPPETYGAVIMALRNLDPEGFENL